MDLTYSAEHFETMLQLAGLAQEKALLKSIIFRTFFIR